MSIAPVTPERSSGWPEWQRVPRTRLAETTRTTLALDRELLGAIDREVLAGASRGRSEFINAAILAELRRRESEAIDASFRTMAADPDYQAETRRIDAEFASAEAETWAQIRADHGAFPT